MNAGKGVGGAGRWPVVHVEAADGDEAGALRRHLLGADGAAALGFEAQQGQGGAAVARHGGEVRGPQDSLRHVGERLVRVGVHLPRPARAAPARVGGSLLRQPGTYEIF